MAIKTPIMRLGIATLLIAGCTTAKEKATPPPPVKPQAPQVAASPRPAAKPRPADIRPPAPPPKPRPQTSPAQHPNLATLIGDGASWIDYGNTVRVTRGGTLARQPVPLFRQAGMLASVRAALADSPIQPWAEFRHGELVLTFTAGSNSEIASAVNKALAASEARNAKVIVQR